jgi:hypothetical protein
MIDAGAPQSPAVVEWPGVWFLVFCFCAMISGALGARDVRPASEVFAVLMVLALAACFFTARPSSG